MITSFGLFFIGGDGGNRTPQCPLRVRRSAIVPRLYFKMFCCAKILIICGFDYLFVIIKRHHWQGVFFGGDGGNRNRVRRRIAKGSTSVVYRLRFPSRIGDKQPIRYGSFWFLMRAEALSHSCSPLIDALIQSVALSVRTEGCLRSLQRNCIIVS